MSWTSAIDTFAQESGISKPLAENILTLTELLERVLEGRGAKDLLTLSTDLPSLTSDLFEVLNTSAGAGEKAVEGAVEEAGEEAFEGSVEGSAVGAAVGADEDSVVGAEDHWDEYGSPINPKKTMDESGEATELFIAIRERVASLTQDQLAELLRLTTIFFHLVNSLEQHEIIRINRERAIRRGESGALPDSIEEAVLRLKELGFSYEAAADLFSHLDIQPTITAHPTEARRRSILNKQESITALIDRLALERLTPMERQTTLHRILSEILLLLSTDEVRPERLTVKDEVENGLFYFTGAIWSTIPRLYDEIEDAFMRHYGRAPAMPVVLKYRSWIGSDRDGNPNVTYRLTWSTFLEQQRAVLQMYHRDLQQIRRYLSVSQNLTSISEELENSLRADREEVPLSESFQRHYQNEPYRRKVTHMMHRIRRKLEEDADEGKAGVEFGGRVGRGVDGSLDSGSSAGSGAGSGAGSARMGYSSENFVRDLGLIRDSLREHGFRDVADSGPLNDLYIRAETFGFHMAALDIRQHSEVHERTVAELLQAANVTSGYGELPEEEKIALLSKELMNPRPLAPVHKVFSAETLETLRVFRMIKEILHREPDAIGSYIISMTHGVSDLLEVLLLAKQEGLWWVDEGEVHSLLDVVPLYETIDDLQRSAELTRAFLSQEVYRGQLEARNRFQEIMLGYSDSNKDGGYWMANWALQKAQLELGEVLREMEIDFRLFHGRGGTVGRGGGRSNKAILALPTVANNGRIRFTEQGEIISFRYSLPEITHRHLEQVINAVVRITSGEKNDQEEAEDLRNQWMQRLADEAMKQYRALIDHPGFWDWFVSVTPVQHIGKLPIASRPVSRATSGNLSFGSLRAIPWVFAWTQVRYNIPGWYGFGTAFERLMEEWPELAERAGEWYQDGRFFKTIVDNAQREMARTHLLTAESYHNRVASAKGGEEKVSSHFQQWIEEDYRKAERVIQAITGQEQLLDNSPVIQRSIDFRNRFTFPLNMMQIELLHRWERASDEERDQLEKILQLSINGVAAAMQSTG